MISTEFLTNLFSDSANIEAMKIIFKAKKIVMMLISLLSICLPTNNGSAKFQPLPQNCPHICPAMLIETKFVPCFRIILNQIDNLF